MVTKHDGIEIIEDADDAWAQWEDSVADFADTEPMGLPEIKEELQPPTPPVLGEDEQIDFWGTTDIAPLL